MKIISKGAISVVPTDMDMAKTVPLYQELPAKEAVAVQQKIALPTMDGIYFKKIQDIVCLCAEGNYTVLHFKNGQQSIVCKTLMEMEKLIGRRHQFVRIHRSHTINLDYLQKYCKGKGGHVEMENGMHVTISTGKKVAFLNALKAYF